jgi:hypothetical protein
VSFSFVWGQDVVSVEPLAKIAVPLYLREVVTGGSASLLLSENGLGSAGVSVTRQPMLPSSPARIAPNGVGVNTVDFFDSSDPVFGPEIFISGSGDLGRFLVFTRNAGVTGEVVSPGVRQVLLGTIEFIGGSVDGQTTVFTAGDYEAFSSDTVTWQNFLTLDGAITPSTVHVQTVVPSPAAGALLMGLAFASRRRGR